MIEAKSELRWHRHKFVGGVALLFRFFAFLPQSLFCFRPDRLGLHALDAIASDGGEHHLGDVDRPFESGKGPVGEAQGRDHGPLAYSPADDRNE